MERALAQYQRALEIDPERGSTLYNEPAPACGCFASSAARAAPTRHDHELRREWQGRHVFGVAAASPARTERLVAQWATAKRWLRRFELTLSPPSTH